MGGEDKPGGEIRKVNLTREKVSEKKKEGNGKNFKALAEIRYACSQKNEKGVKGFSWGHGD